jgi:hypothetical protein
MAFRVLGDDHSRRVAHANANTRTHRTPPHCCPQSQAQLNATSPPHQAPREEERSVLHPRKNIQWTFSEHSVNIQWTFSEYSVNIQWTTPYSWWWDQYPQPRCSSMRASMHRLNICAGNDRVQGVRACIHLRTCGSRRLLWSSTLLETLNPKP